MLSRIENEKGFITSVPWPCNDKNLISGYLTVKIKRLFRQ